MCGIRDEKIQRRLLVEKKLTFQKAYEIATSMEVRMKNMTVLQESKESETVNKLTIQAEGTDGGPSSKLRHGPVSFFAKKLRG